MVLQTRDDQAPRCFRAIFTRAIQLHWKEPYAPFTSHNYFLTVLIDTVAYMEIRTMAAQIVLGFDVALAKGEDGTRLMTETHDHFTLSLGQLDLVFTPAAR